MRGARENGPVNCPGCGASVDAGTAICPQCDFIIDTSFLEGVSEPPPEAAARDDATRPRATMPSPPPGRAPTGSRKPVARAPTGARPAAAGARPARPATGGARPATRSSVASRIKSSDEDGATPPRGTRAPAPRAMPEAPVRTIREESKQRDYQALAKEFVQEGGPKREEFKVQKMTSADEAYSEAAQFMGRLGSSDKLAAVGIALVVLVSFFPWKTTAAEGEVLGLMSLGILGLVGALVAGGALYARVQRLLPNLNPVIPWFVQLGAICFVIVWCLIFIKLSWDGTLVQSLDGNVQQPISKPDVGVYSALMSALLALGGTLIGLKEQPPDRR